jgi:outer membrane protein OmpA-like peptidoglycan-associated protein
MRAIKIVQPVLTLMFFTGVLHGQNNVKKGDKNFNDYSYFNAIEFYEKEPSRSLETERNLAQSYLQIGNTEQAELALERIVGINGKTSDDIWEYAQVLLVNQKYDKALEQLNILNKLNPNDARVKEYLTIQDLIEVNSLKEGNISVKNLSMNSEEQDISPVVYNNQLLFSSSRSNKSVSVRNWSGNNLGFLDVYVTNLDGSSSVQPYSSKKTSSKFNDGPTCFSSDGKEMYITRNNKSKRSQNGVCNFELYISKWINNEWSEPIPFSHNSPEYSIGHAAISSDGSYLLVASDMPNGKGGVDIYICKRVNDEWSAPVNVKSINTSSDEMFPVCYTNGMFSFSSNGHKGIGGLDVFIAQFDAKKENVRFENIGAPINSSNDDFAMFLNNDLKTGYFSSNRNTGKGNDDIYSLTMKYVLSLQKLVSGRLNVQNKEMLKGVSIVLKDADGKIVSRTTPDENGNYTLTAPNSGKYFLEVEGGSVESSTQEINITDADEFHPDALTLKNKINKLTTQFKDENGNPLSGATVTLKNKSTGQESKLLTDENGWISLAVPNSKEGDVLDYDITIEKEGYLPKMVSVKTKVGTTGNSDISKLINNSLTKAEKGVDVAKAVELKNIHFDYGKFDISAQAATELDKIVLVMKKYPTMVIASTSHTDCRGSAESNMALSEKRSAAAMKYIQEHIKDPSRISGKGMGESNPVAICDCDDLKKPCTEEQHSENRRTEFIIVKL